LEQRGWSGILIEPLRECAERLRTARRARAFEVAAGAPEDEGSEMPLLVAGALSTLNPSIVEDVRPVAIRQVPVRTLDSILAKAGIDRVDFLSVDVERAELAVLRGFSVAQYRPRLILIEDDVQDLASTRISGRRLQAGAQDRAEQLVRDERHAISRISVRTLAVIRKLYLGTFFRRLKRRRRLGRALSLDRLSIRRASSRVKKDDAFDARTFPRLPTSDEACQLFAGRPRMQ